MTVLTPQESQATPEQPPSRLRVAITFMGMPAVIAALLIIPAGRLDWLAGWLYLGVVMLSTGLSFVYLRRRNPALIENRSRFHKGTKTWDLVWSGLFAPLLAAVYVIAGLDSGRFDWSSMALTLWPLGLAIFLFGTMLFVRSMGENEFFEKTVRIQSERGHRVIDTGPYRIVRHPGYVGFIGWIVSIPLLLGSWWAFIPAALSIVAFIIRTALEDRTLREELPGYADYATRVRYRLLPYIW